MTCVYFLYVCRFEQLLSLGKRVSSRPGPHNEKVEERMRIVATHREELREAWERRNKELKQCSELQVHVHGI